MINEITTNITELTVFPDPNNYTSWSEYSSDVQLYLEQMGGFSVEQQALIEEANVVINQINSTSENIENIEIHVEQLKQDTQDTRDSSIIEITDLKNISLNSIENLKTNSLNSIKNLKTDSLVLIENLKTDSLDLIEEKKDLTVLELNAIKDETIEAKNEAKKWAVQGEDVEVEESKYSAMHYAIKAAAIIAALPPGSIVDTEIGLSKTFSSFKITKELEKKQNKNLFEKKYFKGV